MVAAARCRHVDPTSARRTDRASHRDRVLCRVIAHLSPLLDGKLEPPDWARLFAHLRTAGTPTRVRAHGLGVLCSPTPAYRYCPAYFNYGVIAAPAEHDRPDRPGLGAATCLGLRDASWRATSMPSSPSRWRSPKLELPVLRCPLRYNMANHPLSRSAASREVDQAVILHLLVGAPFPSRRDLRVAREPGGIPGPHRLAG